LKIIREDNNREIIKLETEFEDQSKRAQKAENERDQLINAMDDLAQNANEIEKN
jgi:hypothetical protein